MVWYFSVTRGILSSTRKPTLNHHLLSPFVLVLPSLPLCLSLSPLLLSFSPPSPPSFLQLPPEVSPPPAARCSPGPQPNRQGAGFFPHCRTSQRLLRRQWHTGRPRERDAQLQSPGEHPAETEGPCLQEIILLIFQLKYIYVLWRDLLCVIINYMYSQSICSVVCGGRCGAVWGSRAALLAKVV